MTQPSNSSTSGRTTAGPPQKRDLRVVHGDATRKRIMDAAMDIASTEGLEALTIGRLATDLGMSKAGIFGHFGSKEALQLATLEAAREVFMAEVVAGALSAEPGMPRLSALSDAWLRYAESSVFRGGCIFAGAAVEFDGRPGKVRDRIREIVCEWVEGLANVVREGQAAGNIDPAADPDQVAFELNALELGGNSGFQLFGGGPSLDRARAGIRDRLARLAIVAAGKTPKAPKAQKSVKTKRVQ